MRTFCTPRLASYPLERLAVTMKNSLLILALSVIAMQYSLAQQPTWRAVAGTEQFAIRSLDVARLSPNPMYALGAYKTLRSSTGGETWDSVSPHNTDFGALRVSRIDPLRFHLSSFGLLFGGNDIWRSTDGGTSWTRVFSGNTFRVDVIEYDPVVRGILYAGLGPSLILRSTDDGESWNALSQPPGASNLSALAICKNDNRILYAGYFNGIFKSTNTGNSWSSLSLGFQFQSRCRIVVDPTNDDVVYVSIYTDGSTPGGMFKSTDGGQTWAEINNGLEGRSRQIFCIAMNPNNNNELLVGLFDSQNTTLPMIFRTTDGGGSWYAYSDGIVNTAAVFCIMFDNFNHRIFAGSAGATSYLYIHDYDTNVEYEMERPSEVRLYQNYPNPFNPSTRISYSIQHDGLVSLVVFDVLGREVAVLENSVKQAGTYSTSFDASRLSSGVYLYRLQSGRYTETKMMVVMK